MAEAAVLGELDAPPPFGEPREPGEPRKNKPGAGRPEGSTKEAVEKEREQDPRSFDERIKALTDAEWEKHIVYIWRTDPWYDNTNGGQDKKYIGRSTQPVTEETLKQEYGSGCYKVQLNRYTSPRNDKPIAFTRYEVLDIKYPPALPPGDWLNHPKNKKWQTWKPLIEQRWAEEIARQTKTPAAVASSDAAALGELTKLIAKLIEEKTGRPAQSSEAEKLTGTLVTWALAQTADSRKAEREENSPSKLAELVKAVKELVQPGEAKGSIDPVLQMVLTGLRDDLKAARDDAKSEREANRILLNKIMDSKKEEANPLGQLDTFTNIFTRMTELANRGGPRDWKDVVAEAASEVLPKALDLTQGYLTQKALNERMVAGRQPAPAPRTAAATAAPAPNPPAPASAPAATPAAAPQSTAAPDPNPVVMDVNERSQLINIALLAAQALNLTLKGDEFAEKICDRYGGVAYDDFVAAFDRTQLLDKLKAVPEAWQLLAEHEPRLPDFIASFYAFADELPDDEEPPPAPKPKPAAKPKKQTGKAKAK